MANFTQGKNPVSLQLIIPVSGIIDGDTRPILVANGVAGTKGNKHALACERVKGRNPCRKASLIIRLTFPFQTWSPFFVPVAIRSYLLDIRPTHNGRNHFRNIHSRPVALVFLS